MLPLSQEISKVNMKYRFFAVVTAVLLAFTACSSDDIVETKYAASDRPTLLLYGYDQANESMFVADTIVRDVKLSVIVNKGVEVADTEYLPLAGDDEVQLFVAASTLTTDSLDVVRERTIFARTPASIIVDAEHSKIGGQSEKGQELKVLGYDAIDDKGRVNRYKVAIGKGEGWVYGKYTVFEKSEATKRYRSDLYDAKHKAVKNPFGGGAAIGCDFYPYERPKFENNRMPESCYSLYLNISPSVIGNIEKYIAFAKQTKINTFVIDIKDNECPGYKAEAMKIYSPTNYARAGANKEKMYQKAVKRLHEEGFYVVGRITCFKDSYLVKDHPEMAITERSTGKPFKHNKAYWPSAYDRRVWQFNVELAKEAVRKFGFNEINFDYVRFPDRMTKIENLINYHNKYDESKVQAIQRFVQYACDEIHAVGAYVSIDVFGEAANPGYTTAYGQYWPAISNIADVICGMPYPDHFSNGYYGVRKPWNHPYEILRAWGERVQDRQSITPTPAIVRTWIQAYNVMRHVDRNGIAYDAENVEKEIRGLFDAGLDGGYMTWLSSSNLEKYEKQKGAFCHDYYKEHKKR